MTQEIFATQNTNTYSAELTRRAIFAAYARTAANSPGVISGGLIAAGDLALSAPGSGMSVNVAAGEAIIGGTVGGAQGGYYARNSAQQNLSVAAANPSNPRVDTVCFTAGDNSYTEPSDVTAGTNAAVPAVVTGTPTTGATLTNLSGVAALPTSSLLLGYVLVPATATNIITADISSVASVATVSPAIAGIGGPTVRGVTNISTTGTRTNVSPGFLSDANDQVTGIVLPTNGLLAIWYQALWQESVADAGRAQIVIGTNQLSIQGATVGPQLQAARTSAATTAINRTLTTWNGGLGSHAHGTSQTADVTTGQVVGQFVPSGANFTYDVAGGRFQSPAIALGGPVYVFAAAGTYTISVQFSATSGTVTASNRKLWVQALPFS